MFYLEIIWSVHHISLIKPYSCFSLAEVSDRTGECLITAQKQQEKASAALSLSATPQEVEAAGGFLVDEEMFASLRGTRWPGRSQILRRPAEQRLTYYIDGAHTPRSMEVGGERIMVNKFSLF